VPQHTFNLWTTYEIQSGDFKGLGFGLGAFYFGERKGDLACKCCFRDNPQSSNTIVLYEDYHYFIDKKF
jgi:outer membrane receptor protein involved in Fe transport